MADRTPRRETDPTEPGAVRSDVTLLARDLDVVYRVHEDRKRPSLRDVVARRGAPRGLREIHAVRGVSLTAHEGEAIGLIGRNGSGKSTLLQAMAGLLPARSGDVYARSQPQLLGVGAALQKSASGRRNIELGGLALGMDRDQIEEVTASIIEWTGLEDFIDLPLGTYSSGMRARLAFAIATSARPDILMIDEALGVGDEEFQRRSHERMAEMLESAGSIFLVSHGMGNILEVCNRVVWLDQGEIVQDGDPETVAEAYQSHMRSLRRDKRQAAKRERKKARKRRQRSEQPGPEQVADTS